MLISGIRAFIPFCLVASAVYVCNDLLDLESDRQHPVKSRRPFAAGDLPLWSGLLLGPAMALIGLALAASLSLPFFGILGLYLLATFYYSFSGKRKIIIDVMLLSGLYSIRLYAGGIATHISISTWTLAYTSFLFLSLALLKRYSELLASSTVPGGRGYRPGDAPILGMLGCASGLLAALPLALYAGSPEVVVLNKSPHWLWLLGAVHIYAVSRLWLLANRGEVSEDPVVFAIRDPATYVLVLLSCAILALSI